MKAQVFSGSCTKMSNFGPKQAQNGKKTPTTGQICLLGSFLMLNASNVSMATTQCAQRFRIKSQPLNVVVCSQSKKDPELRLFFFLFPRIRNPCPSNMNKGWSKKSHISRFTAPIGKNRFTNVFPARFTAPIGNTAPPMCSPLLVRSCGYDYSRVLQYIHYFIAPSAEFFTFRWN